MGDCLPVAGQALARAGFLACSQHGSAVANEASGGYDVVAACQLPKLDVRVRFPLPAPTAEGRDCNGIA